MTRDEAVNAHVGQVFYHVAARNRNGSALRARVNGKCKTWKRRPQDWSLPMKYGLKQCFYITHSNCHEWTSVDLDMPRMIHREACRACGLKEDTPWQIVYDKLIDMGRTEPAERLKAACEGVL